jgi:hypothetical protein
MPPPSRPARAATRAVFVGGSINAWVRSGNAIVVLGQPSSRKNDMISAGCNRAATSRKYGLLDGNARRAGMSQAPIPPL